jgi:hypothetical protein
MMALTPSDVRRLALALPGSAEAPHHDMTSFRVGGKLFATMPPEGDRVHIFVSADEVAASCAEYPDMIEELWWGKKLSGCRVLLAAADGTIVRELLAEAWRRKAPKKLLDRLDS